MVLPFSMSGDLSVTAPSSLSARSAVTRIRRPPDVLDKITIDVIFICFSLGFRKGAKHCEAVRIALNLKLDFYLPTLSLFFGSSWAISDFIRRRKN